MEIRTQHLTPEVYYKRSRDFQLLGRVYDIVFNYMKTNSELISYDTYINSKLVDLVCTTLGFKETHQYNIEQLRGLVTVFTKILRNKGNLKSIDLTLAVICKAEGLANAYRIVQADDGTIDIYVSPEIENLILFEDVLNYILPAGVIYRIIKSNISLTGYDDPYKINTDQLKPTVKHTHVVGQVIGVTSATLTQLGSGLPSLNDIYAGRLANESVIAIPSGGTTSQAPYLKALVEYNENPEPAAATISG